MYVLDGAKVFGVFGVCIVLYLIRGNKHSQFGREGGKKEMKVEVESLIPFLWPITRYP